MDPIQSLLFLLHHKRMQTLRELMAVEEMCENAVEEICGNAVRKCESVDLLEGAV